MARSEPAVRDRPVHAEARDFEARDTAAFRGRVVVTRDRLAWSGPGGKVTDLV